MCEVCQFSRVQFRCHVCFSVCMFHVFSVVSCFSRFSFLDISLKGFTIAKREPTPTQKRNSIKYLWLNSVVKGSGGKKEGSGLELGVGEKGEKDKVIGYVQRGGRGDE